MLHEPVFSLQCPVFRSSLTVCLPGLPSFSHFQIFFWGSDRNDHHGIRGIHGRRREKKPLKMRNMLKRKEDKNFGRRPGVLTAEKGTLILNRGIHEIHGKREGMKPLKMRNTRKGTLIFNHGWDWITRMGKEKIFTAEYPPSSKHYGGPARKRKTGPGPEF